MAPFARPTVTSKPLFGSPSFNASMIRSTPPWTIAVGVRINSLDEEEVDSFTLWNNNHWAR